MTDLIDYLTVLAPETLRVFSMTLIIGLMLEKVFKSNNKNKNP